MPGTKFDLVLVFKMNKSHSKLPPKMHDLPLLKLLLVGMNHPTKSQQKRRRLIKAPTKEDQDQEETHQSHHIDESNPKLPKHPEQ
jgi:hypothetical protein